MYDYDGSDYAFVITRADRKGDAILVATGVVFAENDVRDYEVLSVSRNGVSWVASFPGQVTPRAAWDYVRLPHTPGESWESEHVSAGGGEFTRKHAAREPEEITVPAGKYKAVRVDSVDTIGDETVRWSRWYVPEIGLVKVTYKDRTRNHVMTLKSFTSGKP